MTAILSESVDECTHVFEHVKDMSGLNHTSSCPGRASLIQRPFSAVFEHLFKFDLFLLFHLEIRVHVTHYHCTTEEVVALPMRALKSEYISEESVCISSPPQHFSENVNLFQPLKTIVFRAI